MSSLPFYESTITMMGKNCKKKPEAATKFFKGRAVGALLYLMGRGECRFHLMGTEWQRKVHRKAHSAIFKLGFSRRSCWQIMLGP
ncbi:hypothetical protein D3C76_1736640 [compost metagenome]